MFNKFGKKEYNIIEKKRKGETQMKKMGFSFHLSNGNHTLSTTSAVTKALRHNLRGYKNTKNYSPSENLILVGNDDITLGTFENFYTELFSESVSKYNESKTVKSNPDRYIFDYLQKVSESKQQAVAEEIIITAGDFDFWDEYGEQLDKRKLDTVFKAVLEQLGTDCPNFKVFNAVVHYDENSPHLHIIGVPIATGQKRGMETRVGKAQVFKRETLEMLQDNLRNRFKEEVKKAYGVQVKKKGKGRNFNFSKEYYIQSKEEGKKILELNNSLEKSVNSSLESLKNHNAEMEKIKDSWLSFLKKNKLKNVEEKFQMIEENFIKDLNQINENSKSFLESQQKIIYRFVENYPIIDFENTKKSYIKSLKQKVRSDFNLNEKEAFHTKILGDFEDDVKKKLKLDVIEKKVKEDIKNQKVELENIKTDFSVNLEKNKNLKSENENLATKNQKIEVKIKKMQGAIKFVSRNFEKKCKREKEEIERKSAKIHQEIELQNKFNQNLIQKQKELDDLELELRKKRKALESEKANYKIEMQKKYDDDLKTAKDYIYIDLRNDMKTFESEKQRTQENYQADVRNATETAKIVLRKEIYKDLEKDKKIFEKEKKQFGDLTKCLDMLEFIAEKEEEIGENNYFGEIRNYIASGIAYSSKSENLLNRSDEEFLKDFYADVDENFRSIKAEIKAFCGDKKSKSRY